MLINGRSLVTDLISDVNYQQRCSGIVYYLREDGWKECYGVLKANLLFLFESKNNFDSCPYLIIVEDCIIDLLDDNQTGKQFSFAIKHKTTGREFILASDTLSNLQRWVSDLTVCPLDYINTIKQSFDEQYLQKKSPKDISDKE